MSKNALVLGAGLALGISLLMAIIGGLIFYFTPLAEVFLPYYALLGGICSTFAGGFAAAHRAGTRGLWHGLGVGLVYLAILLVISALFLHPQYFHWQSFFYYLLAGLLGGVAGVGSA